MSPEEALWRVENLARVSLTEYQVTIGVLVGSALFGALGRLMVRIVTRRRLFIDDGFLILGMIGLVTSTVILYQRITVMYIALTLLQHEPAALALASANKNAVLDNAAWEFAYIFLLWTCVFSVKWCYFAFFRPLFENISSSLTIYYWFSVAFSVPCWLLLSLTTIINCPYIVEDPMKCFPDVPTPTETSQAVYTVGPILNIITDLMVISIPILILRMSDMRLSTKISLGSFLCLSVFMVMCTIVRVAGHYDHNTLDYIWQTFWLHVEGCIAVMMASITVFRKALTGAEVRSNGDNGIFSLFRVYLSKLCGCTCCIKPVDGDPHSFNVTRQSRRFRWRLPSIPAATMTGLRSFVDGNSRTVTSQMRSESALDLLNIDYHTYVKEAGMAHMKQSSDV